MTVVLGFCVCGLAPGPAASQTSAPPAAAPDTGAVAVRIVTVRVVADEMVRANPGWEPALRQTIGTVSAIYERTFQIRLVAQDIVPWTLGPGVPMRRILARLRSEIPVGSADVVIAFAAGRCERLQYGVARVFDRFALVQTRCPETMVSSAATPEAVLSHEVAHLFGAFHPAVGVASVMRAGPADRFDDQTVRVIRLMRQFDFARGVRGLDPEARRAWSAIYAEGHARLEPNPLASAVANVGWEFAGAGRTEEGLDLLHEAVAIDPTAARPHTMLGAVYSAQGRLPEAIRELETAKGLDFRETDARVELGYVLLRLGREDEALAELRDALRVDRESVRAHVGVGTILSGRNRMPEAIASLTYAIQLDAKYGPAHLRLAEALDKVGRPAEAWASAERAHGLGEQVPADLWQRLAGRLPAAPPWPPACADSAEAVIDLEKPEPSYREYAARIRERIRARQVYPRAAREHRVQGDLEIEFQLARSGRLDCLTIRRPSGSAVLDAYTMDTIRLAQPFPSIPAQIAQAVIVFRGTFRYQIAGGRDMR
ncbi:MAG TPA: TonB family protein [Methylomirabilota bacterium]|nr:TonB family protein [Methylomirabilota bacterium]